MASLATLPGPILCRIFDATTSLSSSVSLARCNRRLYETWALHLATLDFVQGYDNDPRWGEIRYKFFAVTIARAQMTVGGETNIAPSAAIKSAYRTAGIVQRTVRELVSHLSSQCPSPKQTADWDRWLPRVLTKTLYMLWLQKVVGRAPLDPQYHLATKEMAEFLLAPKWRTWGYPDMRGVLGAGSIRKKAPVGQLADTCEAVSERVDRNKKALGMELGDEDEPDSDEEDDEFYDDSEYDDISDLDDEEFDDDELDEDGMSDGDAAAWSDEE